MMITLQFLVLLWLSHSSVAFQLLTSYHLFQLSFVRKVAKRRSNISLYADELGRGFVGELDYNIEAANATKFLVLILVLSC